MSNFCIWHGNPAVVTYVQLLFDCMIIVHVNVAYINAENVSIWWRHYNICVGELILYCFRSSCHLCDNKLLHKSMLTWQLDNLEQNSVKYGSTYNFSSFKNMNMSATKCRLFCRALHVSTQGCCNWCLPDRCCPFSRMLIFWDPSTNGLCGHNSNFAKTCAVLAWKLMMWSGHNFAHATTAELSWHVQNYDMFGALELELGKLLFTNFHSWAHKSFVN